MLQALNPSALEELVYLALDSSLQKLVSAASFEQQVFELIQTCERRGNLAKLLTGLMHISGSNAGLRALAGSLLRGRGSSKVTLSIDLNDLSGTQKKVLSDAILSAFNREELRMLLSDNDQPSLEWLVRDYDFKKQVFDLILRTQREGWTDQLIRWVQESRPANPNIRNLVSQLHLIDVEGDSHLVKRSLEQTVREKATVLDLTAWMQKITQLRAKVCRIEDLSGPRRTLGTGFLVGPDLVLTSYHVAENYITTAAPDRRLTCRFDYALESDGENPGLVVPVGSPWLIDYSRYSIFDLGDKGGNPIEDELDYALIRLVEQVGHGPAGNGEKRGWVTMSVLPPLPERNDTIFIMQHPETGPIKFAIGTVISINPNGTRISYDVTTEAGSSGSPCFDVNLSLIALHQTGDPNWGGLTQYNQGIPINRIIDRLAARSDVPQFWK